MVKSKKKLDKLRPFPRPRKPLASKEFDPLEENVITYFDVREIYPFIVDMDLDKSQVRQLDYNQTTYINDKNLIF